jgi:hypothetical protein
LWKEQVLRLQAGKLWKEQVLRLQPTQKWQRRQEQEQ